MNKNWYLWRLSWRLFFARVKHHRAYVNDYRKLIEEREARGERTSVILTDLGTPKEICALILKQPGTELRHKWTWQEILVVFFLLLFGIPLLLWLFYFALAVFLVVVGLVLVGWFISWLVRKRG